MKISEVKTEQNQTGHGYRQKQKRGDRRTIAQNHFQTPAQERAKLPKPTGRTAVHGFHLGQTVRGRLRWPT